MGKTGPCCHCGAISTPLWRNGPSHKPVLCNACGTRWRTRGTLANYRPLQPCEASEARSQDLKERKKNDNLFNVRIDYSDEDLHKFIKVDMSNHSSSGSAISCSESCAHYSSTYANELAGPSQTNVYASKLPSNMRTTVRHPKRSPIEKLASDLFIILHEQQSSGTSGTLEEDLIYPDAATMDSFETGYGCVLLRNPTETTEEESESSSEHAKNGSYITAENWLGSVALPVIFSSEDPSFSNAESEELEQFTEELHQDNPKRNTISHATLEVLWDKNSPLASIDINDVCNFENFMTYFTHEDQQNLLQYLPFEDIMSPRSIESMFFSAPFVETVSCFQKLLQQGVFSHCLLQTFSDDCSKLKDLLLGDLQKSKWVVEFYEQLKEENSSWKRGAEMVALSNSSSSLKRRCDNQTQSSTGLTEIMRSSKRARQPGYKNHRPICSSEFSSHEDEASKYMDDISKFVGDDGACFSEFVPPPDQIPVTVPLHYTCDRFYSSLLDDSPCSASFSKVELLQNHSNQRTIASSIIVESESAECGNSSSD